VDEIGGRARAGFVDVGADHVGALAGEDQRRGAADAARRAGDDDGLAGEIIRCLRHGAAPSLTERSLPRFARLHNTLKQPEDWRSATAATRFSRQPVRLWSARSCSFAPAARSGCADGAASDTTDIR